MRANDQAGNTDASPETRELDGRPLAAPQTTLASSGPSGRTNSTSAAFSYSSEAGAAFSASSTARATPAPGRSCPASGQSYSDLTTDGDYTLLGAGHGPGRQHRRHARDAQLDGRPLGAPDHPRLLRPLGAHQLHLGRLLLLLGGRRLV